MSNGAKNIFLGVDIGASSVKISLLSREKGGRMKLLKAVCEEYGSSSESGPQYQPEMLSYILKKFLRNERWLKNIKVGISIAGQAAFVRLVTIPETDPKKLRQIVHYETQQQIPFPMEDVVWDFQVYSRQNGQLSVLLAAVKKELILSILSVAQECQFDVDFIDVSNWSVYNCLHYFIPEIEKALILDCGAKTTNIIVINDEKIWTRSLPIGGEDITEAVAARLKVNYETAEKYKKEKGSILMLYYGKESTHDEEEQKIAEAITSVLTDLTNEIVNTLNFYKSQETASLEFDKVLLTGGVSKLKYIDRFFYNSLSLPAIKIDYFSTLNVHPDIDISLCEFLGASIGSALRGMAKTAINIDLLPEEHRRIKDFRPKIPMVFSVLVIVLLILFGIAGSLFNKVGLKRTAIHKIKQQVLAYQKNETNLRQVEHDINTYQNSLRDISACFKGKFSAMLMLNSLAEVLPDAVWIEEMQADWEIGTLNLKGSCEGTLDQIGVFEQRLKDKSIFSSVNINEVGKQDDGKVGFAMNIALPIRGSNE